MYAEDKIISQVMFGFVGQVSQLFYIFFCFYLIINRLITVRLTERLLFVTIHTKYAQNFVVLFDKEIT